MSRVKPMAAMAGSAKPFVWFGRACDSLTEADVATIRGRLVRELAHVVSYMAVSDLGEQGEGPRVKGNSSLGGAQACEGLGGRGRAWDNRSGRGSGRLRFA